MKKFRNALANVFAVSCMVTVGSTVIAVILGIINFFKYSNFFFTTAPNYTTVVPTLYKVNAVFAVVAAIGLCVCLVCIYIRDEMRNNRR